MNSENQAVDYSKYKGTYKIYCFRELGTDFTPDMVLPPIKKFMELNDIPSLIVKDLMHSAPNEILVSLENGSFKKYGVKINSAFAQLPSSSYSFSCRGDSLSFWAPCLENVLAYNAHYRNVAQQTTSTVLTQWDTNKQRLPIKEVTYCGFKPGFLIGKRF